MWILIRLLQCFQKNRINMGSAVQELDVTKSAIQGFSNLSEVGARGLVNFEKKIGPSKFGT